MSKNYTTNEQSGNNKKSSLVLPAEFNLTDSDIEKYRRKFITPDQLKNEGRRRVSDSQGREILNPYNSPDFNRQYKNCSGCSYAYRTFFDADNPNSVRQYRIRRDHGEPVEKCGEMKEKGKYLSTYGAANMFYVPHGVKTEWLADGSMPVVFFEGEDKATAAARVASDNFTLERWRFIPVALAGVWNFRTDRKKEENGIVTEYKGLLPDFDYFEWKNRQVKILFDANVHINHSVKAARRELAAELDTLEALVFFAELAKKFADGKHGVNGFDDYLFHIASQSSDTDAIKAGQEIINSAFPANTKPKKENQATRILNFADDLELFHTPDGDAFATIETTNGHLENHFLRSKAFRSWLAYKFFQDEGQMPSTQALQDALNTLEGKAIFEGAEIEMFVRLASVNGKIYLDLCNENWQIIEISKTGWQVIESRNAPVKFYRTKAMLPLPMPIRGGNVQKLKDFLNVNKTTFILIVCWLVNCFRPGFPFPVIIITGEQGSAKSTASRVLRRLVDPNKTDFRSTPRDERDLVIAATNAWLCAYDNISNVLAWLSDALCRISTGGGFSTRTLYENMEETIFAAKRPILLNGIGSIADKGDLLDRAILVSLQPIPKDKRKTESEFWSEFEREEVSIFSGLLDTVAEGLKMIEQTKLAHYPRMADFAQFATAIEGFLGFEKDAFINAFEENKNSANYVALEGSPLAETIQTYVKKHNSFEGNLQQFLDALKPFATEEIRKSKDYPKTPRGVRSKLERINPNLRAIGIHIEFLDRTDKGQIISLRTLEQGRFQPSEPSEPSDALQTKDLTPDGLMVGTSTVSQPSANRQNENGNKYNSLAKHSDGSDGSDGLNHTYSNNKRYVQGEI